ncbi:hypothetical protein V498_08163 [Pseudogymnoascus sp. VKM F-4517 (FW-2822)]|nr:hypothetical protein V498_08163 [Pseudogymnoascus sp. VKM F-4517 (FW-2822)]
MRPSSRLYNDVSKVISTLDFLTLTMAFKNALLAVAVIAPTVLAQGGAYSQCNEAVLETLQRRQQSY